ncbi:FecR family protein [Mucilaginibacter pedocola]|uniref:Anti-sigma factor n=1 Tax=Mucilaginibacter pedocola TaxID=1792845 RepID=A0A1S9PH60_9SPHI|nr:FecR domain-containing protein [Mucilaginibacter pedocola]OOQ60303.1 hypothetical protein BC343_26490 [Mucilaginibacter pedocola]
MEKEHLRELFKKYKAGTCTEEEKALLEAWYLQYNEQGLDISSKKIKAIGERIFRELPGNEHAFIKIGLQLAAAAAAIGIAITIALNIFFSASEELKMSNTPKILPGKNTALLTLANGQQIGLDTASNGNIVRQQGFAITKAANGLIIYKSIHGTDEPTTTGMNAIATPKGGQWQVKLPDGTTVRINSASSLQYRANLINGRYREVYLKGEAYFEVAKDRNHPFIVKTAGQQIEVLGTHFNVNAYPDEPDTRTTLAEGSVKVTTVSGNSRTISPGHQAILTNGNITVDQADTDDILAWTKGSFHFHDENIREIMRQVARWYDIEVIYNANAPQHGLNGRISRSKELSQVLQALEATGSVHFKQEGRRITVMQ